MTISSVDGQIADVESKRATLAAELKSVNDRAGAEGDRVKKVNHLERAGNVVKGLERLDAELKSLTKARTDEVLGDLAAGRYGIESGDGSPDSRDFGHQPTKASSPIADAVIKAGFDLHRKASVTFNGHDALKTQTLPGVGGWSPTRPASIANLGQDRRFLWPLLPTERAGDASSIEDFRQTARVLTGTVQRAIDATSEKALVDTTTTLVNTPLQQFAVVLDDIPNQVIESVSAFSAFMAGEGEFQVMRALDAHVMAAIVASVPAFGQTGANLILQMRNAVGSMRALGANPTIAVLNPVDSAALDTLTEAGSGAFLFPTSSANSSGPLWGLTVVERIGAGTERPHLIDPQMLGVLYLGDIKFDADPYTGFSRNTTRLRVEVNALFHVRNAQGAHRIHTA